MALSSPTRLLVVAATLLLTGCGVVDAAPASTSTLTAEPEEGVATNFIDLEVGDCFDIPSNLPAGEALLYSSCDVLHMYEAFAETALPDGDFPGEDGIDAAANAFCEPAFTDFVGESWTTSDFDFQFVVPSDRTWNELGDRSILCMVTTLSAVPWTGSAANGGR